MVQFFTFSNEQRLKYKKQTILIIILETIKACHNGSEVCSKEAS